MKRRTKIILITAGTLCLLLCALLAFLCFTAGDTYVSEGITQNHRISMENVKFENGVVTYTLRNRSSKSFYFEEKPFVEKRIDGQWVSFPLWQYRTEMSYVLDAFSEQTCSFAVDANTDRLAGEYRLSFGSVRITTDENGASLACFDSQKTYLIGHLTITEEQSPTTTPAHIYYDNGVKKHDLVAFCAAFEGGAQPKLLLTVTNHGEQPLILQLSHVSLYRYQNAYFHHIPSNDYYMLQLEDVTVAPGETLSITRPIYNERYTLEPIDPPPSARYCVNIPCYFEGATEITSNQLGEVPRDLFYADFKFDHH